MTQTLNEMKSERGAKNNNCRLEKMVPDDLWININHDCDEKHKTIYLLGAVNANVKYIYIFSLTLYDIENVGRENV